jgi:hypothetical protein
MDTKVSQLSIASVFMVEHLQGTVWHIKPTFRKKMLPSSSEDKNTDGGSAFIEVGTYLY